MDLADLKYEEVDVNELKSFYQQTAPVAAATAEPVSATPLTPPHTPSAPPQAAPPKRPRPESLSLLMEEEERARACWSAPQRVG